MMRIRQMEVGSVTEHEGERLRGIGCAEELVRYG